MGAQQYSAPEWSTASMGAAASYGYMEEESASSTNPYNAQLLASAGVQAKTVQAAKVMPVKKYMGGEEHVVHGDLQVHENHEADKVIVTKRVVHHSPVLHKTIRTHQIAQDVVHDKQVHHMNTVEDRVKTVPGKEYMGGQQSVDHTVANPPAPQIVPSAVNGPMYAKNSYGAHAAGW